MGGGANWWQRPPLTAGVGLESHPVFSPDGSQIAFAGEYDGNLDVYVVPVAGGQPKRLTYHPDPDLDIINQGGGNSPAAMLNAFTLEVPEPSSIALMGLGGLLIARRFRSKACAVK